MTPGGLVAAGQSSWGDHMDAFYYKDTDLDSEFVIVEGVVRWFDPGRGFGFVVSTNSTVPIPGDILLHTANLRDIGRKEVHMGARITCRVVHRARGWQVMSIDDLEHSPEEEDPEFARPLSRRKVHRQHHHGICKDGNEREMEPATVKWFDRMKGYGFVTGADPQSDIFIHIETIKPCGLNDLAEGDTILVRYGNSPKGLVATEMKLCE